MKEIDGSYGEGGGQIVRTALALSTLTSIPVRIHSIRQNRKDSGLKAQHVAALNSLAKLCNARVSDTRTGSSELEYFPGKLESGTLSVDIGTAGSLTLLLQSVLLPACFASGRVRLKLRGGTDVQWSPLWDYFTNVVLPYYRPLADIECRLLRRGYYPKGGGKIELKVVPRFELASGRDLQSFRDLSNREQLQLHLTEQRPLQEIRGVAHAAKQLADRKVAERLVTGVRRALAELGLPVRAKKEYCDTSSISTGITIWCVHEDSGPTSIAACALGELRKKAEDVGAEAANELLATLRSEAACDPHLADHLIPFLGLFGGELRSSRETSHLLTNIHTVSEILDTTFLSNEGRVQAT